MRKDDVEVVEVLCCEKRFKLMNGRHEPRV